MQPLWPGAICYDFDYSWYSQVTNGLNWKKYFLSKLRNWRFTLCLKWATWWSYLTRHAGQLLGHFFQYLAALKIVSHWFLKLQEQIISRPRRQFFASLLKFDHRGAASTSARCQCTLEQSDERLKPKTVHFLTAPFSSMTFTLGNSICAKKL